MRRFVTKAVAFATLALMPAAAWAHAVLVSSTPEAHAVVSAGHLHVVLKFNSRVDAQRSTLELADAQGGTRGLSLDGQNGPDAIAADADELKPGSYTLKWQALSSDGHITRGQIPFEVK